MVLYKETSRMLSKPQQKLNRHSTSIGFNTKMTFHDHHHTTHSPRQDLYLRLSQTTILDIYLGQLSHSLRQLSRTILECYSSQSYTSIYLFQVDLCIVQQKISKLVYRSVSNLFQGRFKGVQRMFQQFLEAQPPNTQICLSVCLPARLFQLASGEVLLTILTSTIVGEYRRVFYNYPGQKMNSATLRLFSLAEQCHTQNLSQVFQVGI